MANQSQPRPRFRFGPMIRPILAAGPPPSPAPAPRHAAAPSLPRPFMIRPPFRPPVAAPPQLAQDAAAPPPPLLTRISDTSLGTQKSPPRSPATQKSPRASAITWRSPPYASPSARKSPLPAPSDSRKSRLSSPVTQESFPAFPVTQNSSYPSLAPQKSRLPATPVTRRSPPSPSSPVTHKTLPESPNIKPAPHSPPSFSLPPSQLHSERESEREIPAIAEQKTVNSRTFPKPRRDNIPKNSQDGINVKSKERETKRGSNPEDIGMRVINISGENRGAVMELGYTPGTHSTPHHLRSNGESSQGNSSRNEGRSNHSAKAIPSQPMHAFMNNNVQGINSSVVFNSTLSFHDPGIHFCFSRKQDKGHLKDHANGKNLFSD